MGSAISMVVVGAVGVLGLDLAANGIKEPGD